MNLLIDALFVIPILYIGFYWLMVYQAVIRGGMPAARISPLWIWLFGLYAVILVVMLFFEFIMKLFYADIWL